MKFTRAPTPCQQTRTPYESVGKSTLKCQEQKCDRVLDFYPQWPAATPNESVSSIRYPTESVNTFWPSLLPTAVVTFLMSLLGRFHHEDGARTP